MFLVAFKTLNNNKDRVDSLNVFPVPDGDTGTNMSLTMNSAINQINKITDISIETIAQAASNGSLMGARGNSGVILSQIFRGFEKGCKGKKVLTVKDFALALKEASNTAYRAVMKPIEGTILTIIRESSEKAVELSKNIDDFNIFFDNIIKQAELALEKTPDMLPVLKQAGVVDAGGKGLIYILKGFYNGLISAEDDERIIDEYPQLKQEKTDISSEITFAYCTEFIIKGKNLDPDRFRNKISNFGDSLLVVGDENLVKVHIHTNNPGKVIEYGLEMGELIDIKIDNMRQQHQNKIFNKDEDKEEKKPEKYGVIAVAMGEGITNIFNDLNVNAVIAGGQTMNPSTEDLLKAVEEIDAENIFILPNNSNIIMTANQVKDLCDKNIIVIPTKSIPQGISAMLEFDPSRDVEELSNRMLEAINSVKTIMITYSVRDSVFNSFTIKKGDIIGIYEGDIVSVGNDIENVTKDALDKLMEDGDYEILTMYYGNEIEEEKANSIINNIRETYPDLDVEMYYGGQPLYYLIFSIE